MAEDFPADCKVIPDERALEAVVAGNESRQNMHPADQFLAFQRLADEGRTVADVATRCGVTERLVRQRPKIAAVRPRLLDLYRHEAMPLSSSYKSYPNGCVCRVYDCPLFGKREKSLQ